MAQFKQHVKEEVIIPATINSSSDSTSSIASSSIKSDSSAAPVPKSSGYIMSLQHKHPSEEGGSGQQTTQGDSHKLIYLGNYEISSPAVTGDGQVQIIDSLVARVREVIAAEVNLQRKSSLKKRSIGARLRSRSVSNNKSSPPLGVKPSVTKSSPPLCRESSSSSDGSHGSSEQQQQAQPGARVIDISVVPPMSPTEVQLDNAADLCPPSNGDELINREEFQEGESQLFTSSQMPTSAQPRKISENADFDTIPELVNLQKSTEFQALSSSLTLGKAKPSSIKVRLMFSGVHVVVVAEESNDVLIKESIKTIACCAQVRDEKEARKERCGGSCGTFVWCWS